MFAIIDRADVKAIKVLDTSDGVVDCVTSTELADLRKQGFEFVDKPEWLFFSTFYRTLVKADIMGNRNIWAKTKIGEVLRKVCGIVEGFVFPDNTVGYTMQL